MVIILVKKTKILGVRSARSFSGNIKPDINPGGRIELVTTCTPKEECFSLLSSCSEVDKMGLDLIRSKGHRNPKKVYLQFQSFIRQGKSFYNSAESLHYRSSSLLYYYSFLNFAKALICLTAPSKVNGKIMHGIAMGKVDGKFDTQTVGAKVAGAFPLLYQQVTGEIFNHSHSLNIVRLLGYCSDIGYENRLADLSCKSRWASTIPALIRLAGDDSKCWPVLAIPSFTGMDGYKKAFKNFHKYFEEVDLPDSAAFNLFDVVHFPTNYLRFYESKYKYDLIGGRYFPPFIVNDIYESLAPHFLSRPYKDDHDFNISIPLRIRLQIPFNEILAIYSVMFFLGDLVRYNPSYLENLLSSKQAWILERFTSSCPITFLRHITNLIMEKNYVVYSR